MIPVLALTIWIDLTLIAIALSFTAICALPTIRTLLAARRAAASAVDSEKESQTKAEEAKCKFPASTVMSWFLGIFLIANLLADFPFLISLYGFGRVWDEKLYIIEKVHGGGPWEVSNGDRLVDGLHVQYLFAMAIFAGLIVVSLFLVGRYTARK